VVFDAMGVQVDFTPAPVVADPVRDGSGVQRLRWGDPLEEVSYVMDAVRACKRALAGRVPLIGFAGAPFTLASYLIEGGPSRDHARTKALMYSDPALWNALADRLARIAGAFLRMQVIAGASALQLFDSWAGALPADDYEELVLPHVRTALSAVADLSAAHGIPRNLFDDARQVLVDASVDLATCANRGDGLAGRTAVRCRLIRDELNAVGRGMLVEVTK
jgi:uroporphyrinogen decarboxylase